jgi:uncharacterized membrane protein YphA (DoxX/SURF4 family)
VTHRSAISRWMFEEYRMGEKSLAISRIVFALALLALWFDPNNPRYLWIAKFPESFYAPPPGLGFFLHRPPPGFVMWLLMAGVITFTIGLLVGWKTRVMGLALAATMLVGNSFEYSFGKINHDSLTIAVALTMSFSGWERAYSADARRGPFREDAPAWPLALLALLIGLAMFSAGWPKLMSGWLDPGTQSAKGHVIANLYATERPTAGASLALTYGPTWLWELLDWGTVGIELAFLPAAFSKRALRIVCALAACFHAGIHFTMDIFFYPNLVAYAMFIDWERGLEVGVLRRAMEWWGRTAARVRGWMLPVAGMLVAGVYSLSGNPVVTVLSPGGDGRWVRDSVLAIAAAATGVVFIVWSLGSRLRPAFTAAGRLFRMQGGIAGGRPGRLGHHPDL